MITTILKKSEKGIPLTKEDAIELLKIDSQSPDFYQLISTSNMLSRKEYNNRGYIFTQIGINAAPCTGNCKFCSLAKDSFSVESEFEKTQEEIIEIVRSIDLTSLDGLFLMTTADYSKEKFLEIGTAVKAIIPNDVQFIANVGDFDLTYANRLKNAGFHGAYHIVRLREEIDTDLSKEKRIQTLDAIRDAQLELYYCVEPIGPEHTPEEIADEMLRARDYHVNVMAIMGRISVPGTKFEGQPELSELELTKIAAVTRLVTNPKKSMNVHEAKKMPLLAGINQLYAEIGINPRDTKCNTEKGRGYQMNEVIKMLADAEYYIK